MKKRIFAVFMLAAAMLVLGGCKEETAEVPDTTVSDGETPETHVHSFTSWRTTESADCTSDGTKVRTCRSCDYKETEKISALGHNAGEWEVVTEVSCTSDGERYNSCTRCGEELLRETVVSTGHDYVENRIYPNRYAEGYTLNICSVCNDGYKEDFVPPFGQVQYLYTVDSSAGACRINAIISSEVTELHIPDYISDYKVVTISDGAFEGMDSLRVVRLPEELTSIGKRAFAGCTSLEEVTFGAELYAIGDEAFLGCTSLKTIALPEYLDTLGAAAFFGCSSLEEISLPSMITEIPASLFEGCTSLRSVSFDTALTKISANAFKDCERLENVSPLTSVSEISEGAFIRAMSLKAITLGDSLTSVGKGAFLSADALEAVNIPSLELWLSVDFADGNANPLNTGAALYLTSDNENPITELDISEAPDYAFYGYKYLEKLTLSEGAEYIGTAAFYGCSALTVAEINADITYVGDYAFCHCSSLGKIELPETVTDIGAGAFRGCSSLASAELPENIDTIGYAAFLGCSSLTEIEISAAYIGASAFEGCTALTDITFADGLYAIGDAAFCAVAQITELVLPEGLVSIGESAFCGCTALSTVHIPSTVMEIGEDAFLGCDAVDAVHIASLDSWYQIDFGSFASNPVTDGSMIYSGGEAVTYIVISDLVTRISDFAFPVTAGIENVYYAGSEADYLALIGEYNPELLKLFEYGRVYFYSPSKPETSGNFWHYSEFGFVCKW